MNYLMRWNFLVFILMVAVAAGADWSKVTPARFRVDPPPRAGSAAFKKDFEELHALQRSRTKADCAEASAQVFPKFESLFSGENGGLSDTEVASLEPIMSKAFRAADKVAGKFKEEFRRPRPYDTDTALRPCVKKPGGDKAYPSFHATAGVLGGCLLAHVYPARKTLLLSRGKRVGDLRVIAGVHHPSDVAAGQDLGQQICEYLLRDPDFLQDLEDAI